jgi:coenzyme F420-reducing hydrogenase delta subunit
MSRGPRKVLAFGCKHTATPVIEGATERPDLEYVELPCLGALDALEVLRALDEGADAVLAIGCYISRCEHLTGSQRAQRVIGHVGDVLKEVGVDRSRVGIVMGSPIDEGGLLSDIMEFMDGQGECAK